jgi:hypothetical protein
MTELMKFEALSVVAYCDLELPLGSGASSVSGSIFIFAGVAVF